MFTSTNIANRHVYKCERLQITCNMHVYKYPDEKQKMMMMMIWFRTQSLGIVTITRYSCWRERPQWNLCSTASFECTHYRTYWCSYGPLGHWSEPGARFGTVGIVSSSLDEFMTMMFEWRLWFMIAWSCAFFCSLYSFYSCRWCDSDLPRLLRWNWRKCKFSSPCKEPLQLLQRRVHQHLLTNCLLHPT